MQKQKSRLLCNFFAITDSFPSPQSGNGSFLRLISCIFGSQFAIGGHATIPNRKKVAIWAVILFLGFRSRLGAARERAFPCRTPTCTPPHAPDAVAPRFPCWSSRTRCYCLQFRSILLWRGLPSWQNWSTLKKPVVQGVSLKELARASALGD